MRSPGVGIIYVKVEPMIQLDPPNHHPLPMDILTDSLPYEPVNLCAFFMVDWSSKFLYVLSTPASIQSWYIILLVYAVLSSSGPQAGSETSSAFTTVHEGASLFGGLLLFLFSLHYITLWAMVDDTRAKHPLGAPSSVSSFSINNNTYRHAIECQSLCPFRVLSIRAIVCGRGAFHPCSPIYLSICDTFNSAPNVHLYPDYIVEYRGNHFIHSLARTATKDENIVPLNLK